jgi:hypothetical protein
MHIQPIEQFKSQSLNARGFDIDMSTKYILSLLNFPGGPGLSTTFVANFRIL